MMFLDTERRALHDRLAGTRVLMVPGSEMATRSRAGREYNAAT